MDPEKIQFAEKMKTKISGIEGFLGEFATYLLENVAACKHGDSDLFTEAEATEIMTHVQRLSTQTGHRKMGTPRDINDALPELMELYGIVATVKHAMENELKVDKVDMMRFFELSARAINFIKGTIEETGV